MIGEAAWAYMKNNSRNLDGTPRHRSRYWTPAAATNERLLHSGELSFYAGRLTALDASTLFGRIHDDRSGPVGQDQHQRDASGGFGDLEQLSLGLNFRPIEDTVFKVSYQFGTRAFNPNTNQRIHDNALVLSAATYF